MEHSEHEHRFVAEDSKDHTIVAYPQAKLSGMCSGQSSHVTAAGFGKSGNLSQNADRLWLAHPAHVRTGDL